MTARVAQALALWGLADARYTLAAERENKVFKISTPTHNFALRLHRPGYRSDQELSSELEWMAEVAKGGIHVPAPVRSKTGQLLHTIAGVQVDLLTWLSGTPLADLFETLNGRARTTAFHMLGRNMAKVHDISDAWTPTEHFHRWAWDTDGLLGTAPLWGQFWENPDLVPEDRQLLKDFRREARADLAVLEHTLDYGLIHADLVGANVMLDGAEMRFIDFDDGGYGFRLFDIATTLLKFTTASDYKDLHSALIQGYTSERHIDLTALDLFMALRAVTYVGWTIARGSEHSGQNRTARFVTQARGSIATYRATM